MQQTAVKELSDIKIILVHVDRQGFLVRVVYSEEDLRACRLREVLDHLIELPADAVGDEGADPKDVVAPLLLHLQDGVQVLVQGVNVFLQLGIPDIFR